MFWLSDEEMWQLIQNTKNTLKQPPKTTADFVYPPYLEKHMTKENKEYVKNIATQYWFTDVKFYKSKNI